MASTRKLAPQASRLKPPTAPKPPKPPPGLSRPPALKRPAGLPRVEGLKGLPGSGATLSKSRFGSDDPEVVRLIEAAMRSRRPFTANYNGKRRELSPLALGMREGGYRLWAYQFGGESDTGCKCFIVAGLDGVREMDGDGVWPESDPGPHTCMDEAQGIQLVS